MNLAFFCRWNTLPTGWNAVWKLLPRSFTASKRPVNELLYKCMTAKQNAANR